jgi:hypothetical protein
MLKAELRIRDIMRSKISSISDAKQSWETGSTVPRNGLYKVSHKEHLLPAEVTLRAGQSFPRCGACAIPVTFRLKRALDGHGLAAGFHVELYELPVQERLRKVS